MLEFPPQRPEVPLSTLWSCLGLSSPLAPPATMYCCHHLLEALHPLDLILLSPFTPPLVQSSAPTQLQGIAVPWQHWARTCVGDLERQRWGGAKVKTRLLCCKKRKGYPGPCLRPLKINSVVDWAFLKRTILCYCGQKAGLNWIYSTMITNLLLSCTSSSTQEK